MNWKIWIGILALVSGGGYYLYTDNINSKVEAKLSTHQLEVETKTNEIKTELTDTKQDLVNANKEQSIVIVKQVIKAKQNIESSINDKPLSPLMKQTLIDSQSIINGESQ
jgi:hypothetical protein